MSTLARAASVARAGVRHAVRLAVFIFEYVTYPHMCPSVAHARAPRRPPCAMGHAMQGCMGSAMPVAGMQARAAGRGGRPCRGLHAVHSYCTWGTSTRNFLLLPAAQGHGGGQGVTQRCTRTQAAAPKCASRATKSAAVAHEREMIHIGDVVFCSAALHDGDWRGHVMERSLVHFLSGTAPLAPFGVPQPGVSDEVVDASIC